MSCFLYTHSSFEETFTIALNDLKEGVSMIKMQSPSFENEMYKQKQILSEAEYVINKLQTIDLCCPQGSTTAQRHIENEMILEDTIWVINSVLDLLKEACFRENSGFMLSETELKRYISEMTEAKLLFIGLRREEQSKGLECLGFHKKEILNLVHGGIGFENLSDLFDEIKMIGLENVRNRYFLQVIKEGR